MTELSPLPLYTAVDYDPFTGPAIAFVASATDPQLEIWIACQLGGDDASRSYNESVSLRFSGSLNRPAFERALAMLVERHESLRSAFSADGQQVFVFSDQTIPLFFADYSEHDATEQTGFLTDYVQQDMQHVFDLTFGPLAKAGLLKLGDTDHFFTLTAHHIICDGWSLGVMLQDLSALYSAFAQDRKPALLPPPSFSQYAADESRFLTSPDYRTIEQFWLDQYRDAVPVLDLPTDFPRPTRRTYAGHRLDFPLDTALVQAVRQMGVRARCSFVTTLMAAFEVLLHRLTGQTDIVLGLPAAGQSATDRPGLVGHCVNLLPLRSQPQPDLPFVTYLKQRKTGLLDALDHQRLTFGSLLKKLPVVRDPSRIPVVPVVFNVDLGLDNGVSFHDLTYQLSYNARLFENFELSLNAMGSDQQMTLEWSYNTQLFTAETITSFHRQFEQLLRNIVEQPDVLLGVTQPSALPHPNPSPKTGEGLSDPDGFGPSPSFRAFRRSRRSWGGVSRDETDYPHNSSLHDLISETARTFPDNIALRHNDRTLTYSKLNGQANQLAQLLLEEGVKPGDHVGIMADRSPELIVSMLAVLKTGAAYVPVDPQHPTDRIEFILSNAGCQVLLVSVAHKNRLSLSLREVVLENVWPKLSAFADTDLNLLSSGDDAFYVLYTSGTTGRPKGVQTIHRGVVNVLYSLRKTPGIGPTDKTATLATVTFDLATTEIYLPLLVGAELVIVDSNVSRNGQALADLLTSTGVTFMQATPATWRMLWEAGWRGNPDLTVISCAEALPMDLAKKLLASCRSLYNYYGPTETTIYATGTQILPTDERITIGRAIDNTQIFILDEHLQPLEPGQPGEIGIVGDGLARGYLNQPDLTAEKFIPFTLSDGTQTRPIAARLYRTGDLARQLPDGRIDYLGRIDQQVKIRGHRIEVAEIEHHILKQEGVKNAVVIAREDTPGDQRLVAYVVPDRYVADETALIRTWREKLRLVLPEFMLPNNMVLLDSLPVTANGKLDKTALPKPGQPKATTVANNETAELSSEIALLTRVWNTAFNTDSIQPDDDFFELGGHSLLAVQVMTRLEKETGRRLPLSTLFEFPTIHSMVHLIRADTPTLTWESLIPIKPAGNKPPIYIIHGTGLNLLNFSSLVKYMDPGQPIYGLQAKGLDGTEEPLNQMEAIAAHYINEILAHNPVGPYALAGYSFGGYVAYEMAQQLTAMGKEVKLLAMFDTDARALVLHRTKLDRLLWRTKRQFPKLLFIGQSLLRHPVDTLRYQRSYFTDRCQQFLQAIGLREAPKTAGELAYIDTVMVAHDEAFYSYRLKPYSGAIDLFRAMTRLYFVEDQVYLGWKDYVPEVRIHDVPGDHATLMHPPHDKALALALQYALDRP